MLKRRKSPPVELLPLHGVVITEVRRSPISSPTGGARDPLAPLMKSPSSRVNLSGWTTPPHPISHRQREWGYNRGITKANAGQ